MSLASSLIPFVGGQVERAAAVAMVDTSGNQLNGFDNSRPSTAAATSKPSAIADAVILPANPARRQVIIFNNSAKELFLQFGAAAVLNKGIPIGSMQPYIGTLNGYTGDIHGIWTAANGTAEIIEITT